MVWPVTAKRDGDGVLEVGGVRLSDLAEEYGTPLYVYDEATIRDRVRAYVSAFSKHYSRPRVTYAGKAWLSKALVQLLIEEGLSIDVVSGGELYAALQAGAPPERVTFHGNNKSLVELRYAIESGIGQVVIDNFDEIDLLRELTEGLEKPVPVMIRLNPGIDVHTHAYRKTGILDSKFGLAISTGDAERAVSEVRDARGLHLRGYHAHIGSQIFETEPFVDTVETLFEFAAEMRDRHSVIPDEISPGGGFGIQYEAGDPATDIEQFVATLTGAAKAAAARHDLPEPEMVLEPGRSIVGPAGVAVYRLGARKEIPGVRTYVSVDGGMADNIRPALYGAVYSAELVAKANDGDLSPYTIAGKYCESGDVLIERVELPSFRYGDLLAIPAAGAYCLAMASNYNLALRPAVVFVTEGRSRLVQRRETLEDLIRRDLG